jgi:DNA repair protein RecN (Recombination protein N)
MARRRQIICITHLPQIAAYADHHFVIEKSSDNKTTYTTIGEITGDDKAVEIARLLGGKNVTPNTLKSAKELIELSKK